MWIMIQKLAGFDDFWTFLLPHLEAKEEAAVGDAEATQRAKTLQELLSKEVPKIAFAKSLGFFEEG